MKKIFLAVLFIFLICVFIFSNRQKNSEVNSDTGIKEIIFNLGADPRTIDPVLNYASDGAVVIMNTFDGLLRVGSDDRGEPACAESWEISDDGLTWTFHLRDNLKWSDGEKLTAQHFKDGFMRLINPETGAPYASYGFFIKNAEKFYNGTANSEEVGIKAIDEKTLEINLEYKNPLMLDYMSFPAFAPARMDIINEYQNAWAAKPETYISNGAFKIESWKHGDGGEITLVKNPNYWDADNVKIDRLRFVFINDPNTSLAAFRAGKLDLTSAVPMQMLPLLIKRGEIIPKPALGVGYCSFNVKRKPFDDVRVRRAFTLAIDRKIIVDKILMSGQRPATGFVCDLVPGTTDEKDFRTEGGEFLPERADVEEARKLLAEAGYPDGKNFPVVAYKYNSNPGNKILAEVLQSMWKKNLGIKVELLNEEWKVFIETRQKGDYDIAREAWILDFNDAANLLETLMSASPQNATGYENLKFDELMKNAALEMDTAKRINFMHEAEKILMEDLPVLPIYFYSSGSLQSKRVKNIYKSPRGVLLFRGAEVIE